MEAVSVDFPAVPATRGCGWGGVHTRYHFAVGSAVQPAALPHRSVMGLTPWRGRCGDCIARRFSLPAPVGSKTAGVSESTSLAGLHRVRVGNARGLCVAWSVFCGGFRKPGSVHVFRSNWADRRRVRGCSRGCRGQPRGTRGGRGTHTGAHTQIHSGGGYTHGENEGYSMIVRMLLVRGSRRILVQ